MNLFLFQLSSICIIIVNLILTVSNEEAASLEDALRIIQETRDFDISNVLDGRSDSLRPRRTLPKNWATLQESDLVCGDRYNVAKLGYHGFLIDSKDQTCSFEFYGSKELKCKVALICAGEINLKPANEKNECIDEFLTISDGTTGRMGGCDRFSFKGRPRLSRSGGSDLYIFYKGQSLDSPCAVFCVEDLETIKLIDVGEPKKITKYKDFKNFPVQDSCTCGIRQNTKGQVVSGHEPQKFEFPGIGSLVFGSHPEIARVTHCGSSLISDQHVITAAHCVDDPLLVSDVFEIEIILHAHLMDKPPRLLPGVTEEDVNWTPGWNLPQQTDADENSLRVQVEKIIRHPLYDPKTLDFDMAILKLKEKVNFSTSKVSPICLPFPEEFREFQDGEEMIVAGWGKANETVSIASRLLQMVDSEFINKEKCKTLTVPDDQTHLCAGHLEGGGAPCKSDSGSPLIYKLDETKNQYLLTGLVSGSEGCAREKKPAFFTNVQEIIQWVYYHTADTDATWCAR